MNEKKKLWFRVYKCFIRLFFRKPKFIYLGEKPNEVSLHLCNHVGAKGPIKLELYYEHNFRFWGTHEMTEGIKSTYKYLSKIYFHEKKHINKFLSKVIAIIATPFLNLVYLGLNLIPTYKDMRLRKTLRESLESLENNQSLVIFPEDSSSGYFDELTYFNDGFVMLLEMAYKKGFNLPIYVMYYQRKFNRYIIDKKIMYDDLLKLGLKRSEIAEMFRKRCNELGKMKLEKKQF